MPALAAPGFLLASALAAAVVVALHLLAWRRPRPVVLPTARFAPPQPVRAASRQVQLRDVALLILRVLALLLVGAALSGPSLALPREGTARVIVVDASRRVASLQEAGDSVRVAMQGAEARAIVRVDSLARVLPDSALGARAEVRGTLAAGMVAAVREAQRLARTAQTVEIVVISPFAMESWDSAAVLVRGAWPGDVRVMRVAATEPPPPPAAMAAREAGALPPVDDPVGAAFALAVGDGRSRLRVRRAPPNAADSAWVRSGGVLVWWPPDTARVDGGVRTMPASMLAWEEDAVIGRFADNGAALPRGRPIVRWGNGAPAATEVELGQGCLRTVAASLPDAGDEALRPAVVRLAQWLSLPCGAPNPALVDDGALLAWARGAVPGVVRPGATGQRTAPDREPSPGVARAEARRAVPPSPLLARLLLLLAAGVLLAEWWWRRGPALPASRPAGARAGSTGAQEAA